MISILITLLQKSNNTLYKVVLNIDGNTISNECKEYYLEDASRKELFDLLPAHVQSVGDIVDVDFSFIDTVHIIPMK